MTLTLVNLNALACLIKNFEIFTECLSYVVTETNKVTTVDKCVYFCIDGANFNKKL